MSACPGPSDTEGNQVMQAPSPRLFISWHPVLPRSGALSCGLFTSSQGRIFFFFSVVRSNYPGKERSLKQCSCTAETRDSVPLRAYCKMVPSRERRPMAAGQVVPLVSPLGSPALPPPRAPFPLLGDMQGLGPGSHRGRPEHWVFLFHHSLPPPRRLDPTFGLVASRTSPSGQRSPQPSLSMCPPSHH